MKKKIAALVVILVLSQLYAFAESALSTREILQHIYEAAKANDKILETYGFWEENKIKKIADDGSVKKEERRTYRTIWIEDHAWAELVQVDGKPLTSKQKEEEQQRQKHFIKSLHQKSDEDEKDLTWGDLYEKYDFTTLPPGEGAPYVFSFRPKPGKLKERSREEKIFNHLSGKFSADANFNLIKAEAQLDNSLTFGWGIIARVDSLQMKYLQQPFHNVFVPTSFHIVFKAKIALVKSMREEIDSRFYDPYPKPSAPAHGSTP